VRVWSAQIGIWSLLLSSLRCYRAPMWLLVGRRMCAVGGRKGRVEGVTATVERVASVRGGSTCVLV
jgi:hypothetical protein